MRGTSETYDIFRHKQVCGSKSKERDTGSSVAPLLAVAIWWKPFLCFFGGDQGIRYHVGIISGCQVGFPPSGHSKNGSNTRTYSQYIASLDDLRISPTGFTEGAPSEERRMEMFAYSNALKPSAHVVEIYSEEPPTGRGRSGAITYGRETPGCCA